MESRGASRSWRSFLRPEAVFLGLVVVLAGTAFIIVALRETDSRRRSSTDENEDLTARAEKLRTEYVEGLLDALAAADTSKDPRQAQELVSQLGKLGEAALPMILKRLKAEGAWNFKMALLKALSRIPSDKGILAAREFYRSLGARDLAYKIETIRTIARSGWPRSRRVLATLLKEEKDEAVREELSRALVDLGMTTEEAALLDSEEARLMETQVRERATMGEKVEKLRKADVKSSEGWELAKSFARKETAIPVAVAAYRRLEERNDAEAAEILLQKVREKPGDKDGGILRTNALASLARMTTSRARTALRDLAFSEEETLRTQVISLIGSFGDEAMIPLLEEIAKANDSESVKNLAGNAIIGIQARKLSSAKNPK